MEGLGGFYTTTLDFDNKWVVRKDETPILKAFLSKYAKDSTVLSLKNVTVPDTDGMMQTIPSCTLTMKKNFTDLRDLQVKA